MANSGPSAKSLSPWRHPCVMFGIKLGACLAGISVVWLVVANRAPSLAQFALERNLIAGAAIGLLMLLPFLLFMGSPARIFLSGIIAWAILAVCYRVLGFVFVRLADRLGAFHLFTLGAVVLGVLAAADWVVLLLLALRRSPLATMRR